MKKLIVVLKILLSFVLIADLILNILLFKMDSKIKKDVYDITWDVNSLDSSLSTIENKVDKIADEVDDIKSDVRSIEWDLDHYF